MYMCVYVNKDDEDFFHIFFLFFKNKDKQQQLQQQYGGKPHIFLCVFVSCPPYYN